MNPNPSPTPSATSTRHRQMAYALGIVLLFCAMFPYSGWLSRVKQREDLGEATIGQVDTGSFMLKLAMIGGARGVAANVLWTRANDLQKVHEWDKLKATVDLITKLQPHFLSIWTFQGWNLAYNVSVEWDAPEDKYAWIKKGINFLKDGVAKNQKSPDLVWDTAWTYYHKLGMADEAILLRRLFYDDPDDDGSRFKIDPMDGNPYDDNFQVARGWFTYAVDKVDREGQKRQSQGVGERPVALEYVDKPTQHKGRPDDLSFRSMPAHAQARYAMNLEKMSIKDIPASFGEKAREEWARTYQAWIDFGKHPFPAFNNADKEVIYIDDATTPTRWKELSENQIFWSQRWAHDMNYPYWKDRSAAEMEPDGPRARHLFYDGFLALRSANYPLAVQKYREGLDLWDALLKRHEDYRKDDLNRKDTGHQVRRYVFALKNIGESPPADMPMKDLYELVKNDHSIDPFDQLEVMRPTAGTPTAAAPRPGR
jgi:hypothetical protein